MAPALPTYVRHKRQRQPTAASRQLIVARRRARLTMKQLGAALGVHYRSISRWELGEVQPSKAQWGKAVAYLVGFVPQDAVELARLAGVASPLPEAVPVDVRAIEEAVLRAADQLDVSPRKVRAVVREILKATAGAHGTLSDLWRAVEEKTIPEAGA